MEDHFAGVFAQGDGEEGHDEDKDGSFNDAEDHSEVSVEVVKGHLFEAGADPTSQTERDEGADDVEAEDGDPAVQRGLNSEVG